MKLLIEISDNKYLALKKCKDLGMELGLESKAILNGTPLADIKQEIIQCIENGGIQISKGNEKLFSIIDKYSLNRKEDDSIREFTPEESEAYRKSLDKLYDQPVGMNIYDEVEKNDKTIQIVIVISEEDYKEVKEDTYSGTSFENRVFSAIANGIQLPKGHGVELVDIRPLMRGLYEEKCVGELTYTTSEVYKMLEDETTIIIEADNTEKEDKTMEAKKMADSVIATGKGTFEYTEFSPDNKTLVVTGQNFEKTF